jgi:hypothetical protein
LRLDEPDPTPPKNLMDRIKAALHRLEQRLF